MIADIRLEGLVDDDSHLDDDLVAGREPAGDDRIIAVASYFRITDTSAEAAFAVGDQFHGKGIATLLLERLAVYASRDADADVLAVAKPSGTSITIRFAPAS